MILVDHYVAESKIHGLGVFSAEVVKKGVLIWEFNPIIDIEISHESVLGLPEHVIRKIHKHGWHHPEKNSFWLAADGDYYMNHSDNPTLEREGYSFVAAKDISAGDELTCDYRIVNVLDYNPLLAIQTSTALDG